ncbi:MAG: cation diffusion facilitator family transporter, partial [Planctomycetota bacterium]
MGRAEATSRAVLTGEAAAARNLAVARLSVRTAAALGLLKLVTAVLTGSLSIVASLVDSVMDLLASSVNYFAVRLAGRPADADHAYGHGKAEGLAGLVQSVVVAFSGGFLFLEGIRRLFTGAGIRRTDLAIAVMLVSTATSVWITWKLRSTARQTGSLALSADAVHYASDVWTNLGVLAALVLIRVTGAEWID